MTDTSGSSDSKALRSRSAPGSLVAAGARIALSGACLLALAEATALFLVTRRDVAVDRWWTHLLWPAFTKLAITYALAFTPLLFFFALARWAILRPRTDSRAEPFLASVFVVTVCLLLGYTDLRLAIPHLERLTPMIWAAAAALGLATHLLLRSALRRMGPSRFVLRMNILAGLSLALMIVGSVSLWRSPLLDPGGFRVRPARQGIQVSGRTNVVWIVLDTARADGVMGGGTCGDGMSFLKRWSASALRFERCMSNSMWTVPSHASMFTGASLRQHGTDHETMWLDDSFVTVAEVLQAEGYRTALFSNNPWVAPYTNLAQGFDFAYQVYCLGRLLRSSSLEELRARWGIRPLLPWWDHDFGAAVTNHLISRWLDDVATGSAPFFLFVNYMEAHLPYQVPQAYRALRMSPEQVARSYQLERRAFGPIARALDRRYNLQGPGFVSREDRETLQRQYELGLLYLDDRVCELIRMLAERGYADNTLVVITSDHGEYLGTHGMWSHRFLAYNDLLHVDLIIRLPRQHRPATVMTPVQLSDLYPTVLTAVLGRPHPAPGWSSRDLLSLPDSLTDARIVVSEYGGPGESHLRWIRAHDDPLLAHRGRPQIAAQDRRFKLMISGDGQRELYDLAADPAESHNLIEDRPGEAERLASFIANWSEHVLPYEAPERRVQPVLSPAVKEALRSLGYLGD